MMISTINLSSEARWRVHDLYRALSSALLIE